jgi:type IV secretion system protein VirD4
MPYGNSGPLVKILILVGLCFALKETRPYVRGMPDGPDWQHLMWGFAAFIALTGAYNLTRQVIATFSMAKRTFQAHRPKRSESSASWLTARQATKAGLTKTKGLFLGILEGQPLFIENGVHGLICAPARKGKTTSFVMPALCHDIGASRVVADMKCENLSQTADLIREEQGHDVIPMNPAHKFGLGNVPYNPMQIIVDDLENNPEDALADAWSMAFQLFPKPPGGERDPYWPDGTRKLFVFVIVGLAALRGQTEAHLPRAYEVLCDNNLIQTLLIEALGNDVLGGELSGLATNIRDNWDDNPKHFDSFREGVVQRLVPFGPSGRLAPSMESCGFRFRDLKTRKITLFLVCDYSRMDVFAPWIGLLIWAALKELVREDNDIPVHFILDEFTNYHLSGLPNALTALGGYGIRCWMVVQELQEIARVYGRDALATILSQTDVKQFFGVSSLETAQLVSRALGDQEISTKSFGLGNDFFALPSLNIGTTVKPLLTHTQVRQLPEDEQIIFVKNLPPIRALKVGYQEVLPWRMQVKPNPLNGGKAFIGELKMRIRNGRAKATRLGNRPLKKQKQPLLSPLFAISGYLLPSGATILICVSILGISILGWPHILTDYTRSGSFCRYVGPPLLTRPVEKRVPGGCPVIIWAK